MFLTIALFSVKLRVSIDCALGFFRELTKHPYALGIINFHGSL